MGICCARYIRCRLFWLIGHCPKPPSLFLQSLHTDLIGNGAERLALTDRLIWSQQPRSASLLFQVLDGHRPIGQRNVQKFPDVVMGYRSGLFGLSNGITVEKLLDFDDAPVVVVSHVNSHLSQP